MLSRAVRTAVTGTAFDPREKAAEVREGEEGGRHEPVGIGRGKRKVCRLCGLPYPLRLAPRGGGTARDCVRGQVCVRSPARARTRPVKKKERAHCTRDPRRRPSPGTPSFLTARPTCLPNLAPVRQNVYFKKDEEALLRKLLSKVKAQADTVRAILGERESGADSECPKPGHPPSGGPFFFVFSLSPHPVPPLPRTQSDVHAAAGQKAAELSQLKSLVGSKLDDATLEKLVQWKHDH